MSRRRAAGPLDTNILPERAVPQTEVTWAPVVAPRNGNTSIIQEECNQHSVLLSILIKFGFSGGFLIVEVTLMHCLIIGECTIIMILNKLVSTIIIPCFVYHCKTA